MLWVLKRIVSMRQFFRAAKTYVEIDKKIFTDLLPTIVFTWSYVSICLCLYFQVFAPTDYNNPLSIKNHNEVLRCFAVLGKYSIQYL